ncbi:Polyketide cyclase / dehydrase and lipid transport [Lentzea fradiae]|uniref:Polyketide cyclase / dehydrase and lipid transport n=1 Tax=Lentzea fradiae TaxID=200378 RepID=A0A1G7KYB8_9PSEU|nr:SRPBCC family protein [Lentzea fradiae]SDF42205.1 Polyketide cyclase / dehydrase and lipid transport [Lentzea fradiae]
MTTKSVPITVFARTTTSPAHTHRVIVPIDLSLVFQRWGPFPGVAGVREQTGDWDRRGESRETWFTDGSHAAEQLTEVVPGHGFAYELSGFTNVLAKLVSGVRGEWSFLPDGSGTSIRWTYDFRPLRGRRWIVAGPFKPLWTRYMRAALARMVTVVHETHEMPGAIMEE